MENVKNSLRDAVKGAGLEGKDVPKAIVAHEAIGLAFAGAAWGVCYAIQPTQSLKPPLSRAFLRVPKGRSMLIMYHRQKRRAMQELAKKKMFQNASGNAQAFRALTSFGDSLGVRTLLKPVTFPAKIWGSIVVTKALKPKSEK